MKAAYHLHEYAILEDESGNYEYLSWDIDKKTRKLAWIRGKAIILEEEKLLALRQIDSEGEDKTYKTIKEVRKALKKLPDWWEKTKYYCVLLGEFAAIPHYSVSGKPVSTNGKEYKALQDMLTKHKIVLSTPPDSKNQSG